MGLFAKIRSQKNENIINDEQNQKQLLLLGNKFDTISTDFVDTLIDIHNKEIEENGKKLWGRCFEKFLSDLFEMSGYEVKLSPDSRGADLYVTKDGITIAIEAKKKSLLSSDIVGNDVIEKIIGIVARKQQNYNGTLKGAVITTHYFSSEAKEIAEEGGIELIDKRGLILLIAQLQPEVLAKAYYSIITTELRECSKCGNMMIRKYYNNSYFWACSDYPRCTHKESYRKKMD